MGGIRTRHVKTKFLKLVRDRSRSCDLGDLSEMRQLCGVKRGSWQIIDFEMGGSRDLNPRLEKRGGWEGRDQLSIRT